MDKHEAEASKTKEDHWPGAILHIVQGTGCPCMCWWLWCSFYWVKDCWHLQKDPGKEPDLQTQRSKRSSGFPVGMMNFRIRSGSCLPTTWSWTFLWVQSLGTVTVQGTSTNWRWKEGTSTIVAHSHCLQEAAWPIRNQSTNPGFQIPTQQKDGQIFHLYDLSDVQRQSKSPFLLTLHWASPPWASRGPVLESQSAPPMFPLLAVTCNLHFRIQPHVWFTSSIFLKPLIWSFTDISLRRKLWLPDPVLSFSPAVPDSDLSKYFSLFKRQASSLGHLWVGTQGGEKTERQAPLSPESRW